MSTQITSLYGRHVTTPDGRRLSVRATIHSYRTILPTDPAPRASSLGPGECLVVGYCDDCRGFGRLVVEQRVRLGAAGPLLAWDWTATNVR